MGEALRTTSLQASYSRTPLFSFSTLEAHFPTKSSRRSTCLPLPRLELGQHLKFPRYEPQSGGPPGLWKFTGLTEACSSKALRKLRSNRPPGPRVLGHTPPTQPWPQGWAGTSPVQAEEEAAQQIFCPQTLHHPCRRPHDQPCPKTLFRTRLISFNQLTSTL